MADWPDHSLAGYLAARQRAYATGRLGGLLGMSDEIPVCPECDQPRIERRTDAPDGPDSRGRWHCRCGADFETPAYREPKGATGPNQGSLVYQLDDADPGDLVSDGGYIDELPHVARCRDCEWSDTYHGTEWKMPREQAQHARGAHWQTYGEHVVDVYPASDPTPDEIHYAQSTNARHRVLHFDEDCDRVKTDRLHTCPASRPPRGTVCERCGRGLERHEVLGQDTEHAVMSDGGHDVSSHGTERRRRRPEWEREGGEGLPPDPNMRRKLDSDEDLVTHLFTCVNCGRRLASPPGPPADGICGNCGAEYVCHTFDPAEYARIRWYGDPREQSEQPGGDE